MSLPDVPQRSLGRLLAAGALIVVGIIVLAPSSAFTVAIAHYYFEDLIQNPSTVWGNVSTIAPFEFAVLSGLVVGVSMLWAGIWIGRRKPT